MIITQQRNFQDRVKLPLQFHKSIKKYNKNINILILIYCHGPHVLSMSYNRYIEDQLQHSSQLRNGLEDNSRQNVMIIKI